MGVIMNTTLLVLLALAAMTAWVSFDVHSRAVRRALEEKRVERLDQELEGFNRDVYGGE